MSFKKFHIIVNLAVVFMLLINITVLGQYKNEKPVYLDPNKTIDRRIEDLLSKMTIEEKVGQLNMPCVYIRRLGEDIPAKFDGCRKFAEGIYVKDIGPCGGFFTLANSILHKGPRQQAEFFNELQKIAIEKTRLKLPLLQTEEGTHGLMCSGGTIFPEGLAIGSTWNMDLVRKIYTAAAKEARAVGIHQLFTLVIEPNRDPRLGRNQEGYSEDPYLCAEIAKSIVEAVQGDDISADDKVVAGFCHYPGQSQPVSGMERGAMEISERTLREVFLPPWVAAIKKGGALGVMAAYPAIDGMYADNMTVNMWVNLDSTDTTDYAFHGSISSTSDQLLIVEVGQNDLTISNDFGIGGLFNGCNNLLPNGEWHMITAVSSDSNASAFVDGVLCDVDNTVSTPHTAMASGRNLGSGQSTTTQEMTGLMDEVSMWNKTLVATEIKELYVKGLAIRNYTELQKIESGDNFFVLNNGETNFIAELNYTPSVDSFYTPILEGDVNIDTFTTRAYNWTNNEVFQCGVIDKPGVYNQIFTVSEHPTGCIIINSSDVVYDGQGFEIDGITAGEGINVEPASGTLTNVTIVNVRINDFQDGIIFLNVDNSFIINSSFNDANDNGIEMRNADFNNIRNVVSTNQTQGSGDAGIFFNGATNNNVTGCTVSGNRRGFTFQSNGDNNIVTNCNITASVQQGLFIQTSSEGNLLYNNFFNNTVNVLNTQSVANQQDNYNISLTATISIIGGANSGGNYWGNPDKTDFSDTCTVTVTSGICDDRYNVSGDSTAAGDGFNVDSHPLSFKTVAPADSCTYISGDWNVDCSDNCIITTNTDLTGNTLRLEGSGTFTIDANITADEVTIVLGCDMVNEIDDGKILAIATG